MLDNLAVLLTLMTLTLWLAVFVYSKNPTRWANRTFAIFSVAVAGWTAGTWLANYFAESEIALLAARVAFPMAALSVYSLLIFFHVFPHASSFPHSKVVIAFGVLAGTLAIIPTTPWIVTGHTMTDQGLKVAYGPLYPVFALYILSCVGYALWIIICKIRTAQGVESLQLKYLFAGLIVPGVLATVTNLLIPLAFGTSRFSQYGPLFSFLMVAMIAHAIIRHRLMDIRVVIRKSVVYVVAFVVAGTILTGLIVGSNLLFPESGWRLSREIVLGLLVAVLFHPLKSRIQHAFDRYLYRGSYNYQRTIREASRVMTTMLDLRALLDHVSDVIGRTVRPELFGVYLRDRDGVGYRRTLSQSFVEGRPADERRPGRARHAQGGPRAAAREGRPADRLFARRRQAVGRSVFQRGSGSPLDARQPGGNRRNERPAVRRSGSGQRVRREYPQDNGERRRCGQRRGEGHPLQLRGRAHGRAGSGEPSHGPGRATAGSSGRPDSGDPGRRGTPPPGGEDAGERRQAGDAGGLLDVAVLGRPGTNPWSRARLQRSDPSQGVGRREAAGGASGVVPVPGLRDRPRDQEPAGRHQGLRPATPPEVWR